MTDIAGARPLSPSAEPATNRSPATRWLASSVAERVAQNPLRVLGVQAWAKRSEIQESISSIRRAEKLGREPSIELDVPWLGAVSRTEGALQLAQGKLTAIERRLEARALWFGAEAKAPLAAYKLRAAPVAEWPNGPRSKHDSALLLLLHLCVTDPEFNKTENWSSAASRWSKVLDAEEYWHLLFTADRDSGFEPRATATDLDAARLSLARAVPDMIAAAAKGAVAAGQEAAAARALAAARGAGLSEAALAAIEGEVLSNHEETVDKVCTDLFREIGSRIVRQADAAAANKQVCAELRSTIESKLAPNLATLDRLAIGDGASAKRSRVLAAELLNSAASAHTWADELYPAVDLAAHAVQLANGTSAAGRFDKNLRELKELAERSGPRPSAQKIAPQPSAPSKPTGRNWRLPRWLIAAAVAAACAIIYYWSQSSPPDPYIVTPPSDSASAPSWTEQEPNGAGDDLSDDEGRYCVAQMHRINGAGAILNKLPDSDGKQALIPAYNGALDRWNQECKGRLENNSGVTQRIEQEAGSRISDFESEGYGLLH